MNRTRFAPLVASIVLFAAGLALGAGKTEQDTSAASKILLTIGLLAFVIALIVLTVSYLQARRTTTRQIQPRGGTCNARHSR